MPRLRHPKLPGHGCSWRAQVHADIPLLAAGVLQRSKMSRHATAIVWGHPRFWPRGVRRLHVQIAEANPLSARSTCPPVQFGVLAFFISALCIGVAVLDALSLDVHIVQLCGGANACLVDWHPPTIYGIKLPSRICFACVPGSCLFWWFLLFRLHSRLSWSPACTLGFRQAVLFVHGFH